MENAEALSTTSWPDHSSRISHLCRSRDDCVLFLEIAQCPTPAFGITVDLYCHLSAHSDLVGWNPVVVHYRWRLTRRDIPHDGGAGLYVLDESSRSCGLA